MDTDILNNFRGKFQTVVLLGYYDDDENIYKNYVIGIHLAMSWMRQKKIETPKIQWIMKGIPYYGHKWLASGTKRTVYIVNDTMAFESEKVAKEVFDSLSVQKKFYSLEEM